MKTVEELLQEPVKKLGRPPMMSEQEREVLIEQVIEELKAERDKMEAEVKVLKAAHNKAMEEAKAPYRALVAEYRALMKQKNSLDHYYRRQADIADARAKRYLAAKAKIAERVQENFGGTD